ncbi:MAG: hypothetical protein Q4B99_06825 [Clostridia bacterium]|nr:hypothetical protein [Clostridia bacterium]
MRDGYEKRGNAEDELIQRAAVKLGRELLSGLAESFGTDECDMAQLLLHEGVSSVERAASLAWRELKRMEAEGALEGEPESYVADDRFIELITQLPCRKAVETLHAARRSERARDKVKLYVRNARLPRTIARTAPVSGARDYARMGSAQFARLRDEYRRSAMNGKKHKL